MNICRILMVGSWGGGNRVRMRLRDWLRWRSLAKERKTRMATENREWHFFLLKVISNWYSILRSLGKKFSLQYQNDDVIDFGDLDLNDESEEKEPAPSERGPGSNGVRSSTARKESRGVSEVKIDSLCTVSCKICWLLLIIFLSKDAIFLSQNPLLSNTDLIIIL